MSRTRARGPLACASRRVGESAAVPASRSPVFVPPVSEVVDTTHLSYTPWLASVEASLWMAFPVSLNLLLAACMALDVHGCRLTMAELEDFEDDAVRTWALDCFLEVGARGARRSRAALDAIEARTPGSTVDWAFYATLRNRLVELFVITTGPTEYRAR